MKYKLIAIDLDGTLLSPDGLVTARTKAAVHQILRAGVLVCFATGRNFTESQTVLEAVAHFHSAVFVGGAMVIDTQKRLTLHRTLMNAGLARELCGFFESRGHAVLALQDIEHAGVDYLISRDIPPNAALLQWLEATRTRVQYSSDLASHSHAHTIRVGIVAPLEISEPIHGDLRKQFGSRIVSHSILVPASGVQVLEVFDPAVNKWEGILHIARRHGIQPGEIIAIGDDVNDIPMVANAGLGVAMGNAHPDLVKVAKMRIGHNRDDGLARFLEELIAKRAVDPPKLN